MFSEFWDAAKFPSTK